MMTTSKAQWREHFAAALTALPEAERAAQTAALHRAILKLPSLARPGRVLVCLSFGAEPDTWALLDPLVERGIEVVVPRTVPRTHALELVAWPCELETRSFGLREPARGVSALPADSSLDTALVLGLAFDRQGVRLGHGAGYFDRFFASRSGHCLRIGVGFDCQLVDRLPREAHDVAMHAVVTPGEVAWRGGPEGLREVLGRPTPNPA